MSNEETKMSNREELGRLVREVWIEWAREQPNPKPSWLVPWEDLSEPDREVDRRIGERLAAAGAERRSVLDGLGAPAWWTALDEPMRSWIVCIATGAFREGQTDLPSAAWKDAGYDPIKAAIARAGAPPIKPR